MDGKASGQTNRRFTSHDGREFWLIGNRSTERHRESRRELPINATVWDYDALLDIAEWAPDGRSYRFLNRSVKDWLESLLQDPEEWARAKAWYEGLGPQICKTMANHPRKPEAFYAYKVASLQMHSLLLDAIRQLNLKRASVEQWTNTLKGLVSKGIRPEELEQSGVMSHLDKCTDKKTILKQAEVMSWIKLSHVYPRLVAESRFGTPAPGVWEGYCHRIPGSEYHRRGLIGSFPTASYLIRYRHRTFGWTIVRVRNSDLFCSKREWWGFLDKKGKLQSLIDDGYSSAEEAMRAAEAKIAMVYSYYGKSQGVSRWEKYSLAGTAHYQELLLQIEDWPFDYAPRHYKTRNVLVHLRLSLRETSDNRKIVFLDEVQSDWHADLADQLKKEQRDKDPIVPPAPFKKEWPLLALKIMLWWAQRKKADGLAWSTAALQESRWQRPPGLLYRKQLPEAADLLAQALGLEVSEATIMGRRASWLIWSEGDHWYAGSQQKVPYTKPFPSYDQAEKFCMLSKGKVLLQVPAIWLSDLPLITQIPIYGIGKRQQWSPHSKAKPII